MYIACTKSEFKALGKSVNYLPEGATIALTNDYGDDVLLRVVRTNKPATKFPIDLRQTDGFIVVEDVEFKYGVYSAKEIADVVNSHMPDRETALYLMMDKNEELRASLPYSMYNALTEKFSEYFPYFVWGGTTKLENEETYPTRIMLALYINDDFEQVANDLILVRNHLYKTIPDHVKDSVYFFVDIVEPVYDEYGNSYRLYFNHDSWKLYNGQKLITYSLNNDPIVMLGSLVERGLVSTW